MKYAIAIILMVLVATMAGASPFLVCDPPPAGETRTAYQFTGDAFFTTKVAEADGSLRYDIATIGSGVHNIGVTACNIWGCSASTPFSFTKGVPTSVGNIHIIAQ